MAWRKRQRYGTLICDLERNRVLDLLPDRNVDTVVSWAERHPGIEVIARDRASVLRLARVAALPMQRRSATTGICFRTRARHYVLLSAAIARQSAAGKAIIAEMVGNVETAPEPPVETSTKLDGLPRLRRHKRSELYAEILHLRETGSSPASNRAPDRHQR